MIVGWISLSYIISNFIELSIGMEMPWTIRPNESI